MAIATDVSTSNVPPETILYYTHELTRTKRRCEEANSAHRLMVKRAKADGVPSDAVLESIAWAKLPPEERAQRIIDRIRVEAARNPDQGQEIAERVIHLDRHVSEKAQAEHGLFSAEDAGYRAGKFGVPIDDNPHPAGSEHWETWRRYWHEGQAANAATLGENAKAANTRRQKQPPGRQASRAADPQPGQEEDRGEPLPFPEAPAKKAGRKKAGAPRKQQAPRRKRAANGVEATA